MKYVVVSTNCPAGCGNGRFRLVCNTKDKADESAEKLNGCTPHKKGCKCKYSVQEEA